MKLTRVNLMIRVFLGSTATCAVLAVNPLAYADGYPAKPVVVLTPWSDGFPANSVRLYASELAKRLGQPFVVQPKPGAGGEVAAKSVIPAMPDGYTLLGTGSSITIRAVTDKKNADGERDLQPIAQITTTPYVIVAKAGRFGSFGKFLREAKSKPKKIDFASAGVGTGMHYLGELINANADVQIVHIPYGTGSAQLQAVLAGDVHAAIISLVTALPQIRAGALEALAVSSDARSKAAPDIPTLKESGIDGLPPIGAWIALFGPKNMASAVVDRLSETIAAMAKDPAMIAQVVNWGAEIPDTSVAALQKVIRAETASWVKLIEEQGLLNQN